MAPVIIKDVPAKEPTAVSSAGEGITVAVVEGSTIVQMVEDTIVANVATTGGARGGDGSSGDTPPWG